MKDGSRDIVLRFCPRRAGRLLNPTRLFARGCLSGPGGDCLELPSVCFGPGIVPDRCGALSREVHLT
eukprot:13065300-Alexandrium_andersonii.AAC.1